MTDDELQRLYELFVALLDSLLGSETFLKGMTAVGILSGLFALALGPILRTNDEDLFDESVYYEQYDKNKGNCCGCCCPNQQQRMGRPKRGDDDDDDDDVSIMDELDAQIGGLFRKREQVPHLYESLIANETDQPSYGTNTTTQN